MGNRRQHDGHKLWHEEIVIRYEEIFFHCKGGQALEQVPREVLESLGESKNSTGQGPEQPEPALGGKLD